MEMALLVFKAVGERLSVGEEQAGGSGGGRGRVVLLGLGRRSACSCGRRACRWCISASLSGLLS